MNATHLRRMGLHKEARMREIEAAQDAVMHGRQRVLFARGVRAELAALRQLVKDYQKLVEVMR